MMQAGDNFEHAMLREIYEQPRALADTIEHYAPNGKLATDVFQPVADALRGRERLVIAAERQHQNRIDSGSFQPLLKHAAAGDRNAIGTAAAFFEFQRFDVREGICLG